VEATQDTPAANTKKSSNNQTGTSLQLLERDVVQVSEMMIAESSSKTSNVVTILLTILQSITKYTISGDAVYLALLNAQDTCKQLNIPDEEFKDVASKFNQLQKKLRKNTPYAH
jgi:hypothetical protein